MSNDDSTRLTLCCLACIVALWCYTLGQADGREDERRTGHEQSR